MTQWCIITGLKGGGARVVEVYWRCGGPGWIYLIIWSCGWIYLIMAGHFRVLVVGFV